MLSSLRFGFEAGNAVEVSLLIRRGINRKAMNACGLLMLLIMKGCLGMMGMSERRRLKLRKNI